MQNDVDLNKDGGLIEGARQGLREGIGEAKKGIDHRRGQGWWERFNSNGEVQSS